MLITKNKDKYSSETGLSFEYLYTETPINNIRLNSNEIKQPRACA